MWETATVTVLVGVVVYVAGQVITKLLLEPVHELRLQIGKVADALLYFANVYYNPKSNAYSSSELIEASHALRRSAAALVAHGQAVVLYQVFVAMRLIPSWKNLREAQGALIGLSSLSSDETDDLRKQVEAALGLRSSF